MARKGAVKRNDLYLKPRVESIKEDNVESNYTFKIEVQFFGVENRHPSL